MTWTFDLRKVIETCLVSHATTIARNFRQRLYVMAAAADATRQHSVVVILIPIAGKKICNNEQSRFQYRKPAIYQHQHIEAVSTHQCKKYFDFTARWHAERSVTMASRLSETLRYWDHIVSVSSKTIRPTCVVRLVSIFALVAQSSPRKTLSNCRWNRIGYGKKWLFTAQKMWRQRS